MPVASAPPYPNRVMAGPTRSLPVDSPPTYEDSANPNSQLIHVLIITILLVLWKVPCDFSTPYQLIF